MAEFENLSIIIDVIDSFSGELNHLLFKLGEVKVAMDAVDNKTIDVDVNDSEVDTLLGKMTALELGNLSNIGGTSGTSSGKGGVSRGGGGLDGGQFERLNRLLTTQVFQMGRMINSFEDVTDATEGLGDAQKSAMSAADKAADSFELSNLRMSDMHNAMAKLAPILFVFIGTIPVLVGAFAALAAAAVSAAVGLASISVLGIMGAAMARGDGDMMEGLKDIFEDIKEDFFDAFKPLMDAFSPLIEDAIDGIGRLFQKIANFGDIFRGVTDEIRGFGSFFSDFIAGTTRDMALMMDAFGPVFNIIGGFLKDMDLLENLSKLMADILPELLAFISLVIGAVQRLVEMSKGFLQVAVVIGVFLSAIFKVLNAIGLTDKRLGVLIATLLTMLTAWQLITMSLWSAVIPALYSVGARVLSLIATQNAYIVNTLLSTAATYGLATAFVALVGAITLGIGALLIVGGITKALSSGFGGLSTDIDSATESLRNFRKEQNRMNKGKNPYKNPDVKRGQSIGSTSFGGGDVNVNVEGDADKETLRNQVHNGLARMERTTRKR